MLKCKCIHIQQKMLVRLIICYEQINIIKRNTMRSMQQLLEQFNKVDKRRQGSIKMEEAIKLVRRVTEGFNEDILNRVIFTSEKVVTFDELLAMLHEQQQEEQLATSRVNANMVEFLHLLQEYRIKCEQQSQYLQAEKANKRILQIREKQMKRHKLNLLSLHKSKVRSVHSLQQNKLVEFNQAWNLYMENYQDAAINSLEKLKAKHLLEMQEEEDRIRNYLEGYMKPSKRVIEFRNKQKALVKQRKYGEAEKMKNYAIQLQLSERAVKSVQIAQRIKKRKQILQKHQELSLLAHLKRIEKDRNEQMKQRQTDSAKMMIKLKNFQTDLVQKQSVQIRQTLQDLRQTMCLTSGKLRQSSLGKDLPTIQKNKGFRVRMNSLQKHRINESMYDP